MARKPSTETATANFGFEADIRYGGQVTCYHDDPHKDCHRFAVPPSIIGHDPGEI